MNKALLFIIGIILLLVTVQSSLALTSHWDCEDDLVDTIAGNNLTSYLGTTLYSTDVPSFNRTGTGGGKSCDFDTNAAYAEFAGGVYNYHQFTINLWAKDDDHLGSYLAVISMDPNSGQRSGVFLSTNSGNGLGFNYAESASVKQEVLWNNGSTALWDSDSWLMVTSVKNATGIYVYLNGTLKAHLNTTSNVHYDVNHIGFGGYNNDGTRTHYSPKRMDEIRFWSTPLSQQNITNLFNCGTATPCSPTPVAGSPSTWGITVKDLYNDTNLAGVNVTFDTGCTNITDSSGFSQVTNNTPGCSGLSNPEDVTLSLTNYFSNATSYSITANSTTKGGMYQKKLGKMYVTEKVSGSSFTGAYNITTDGGKKYANGTDMYVIPGLHNYTFSAQGWYNKTQAINIPQIGLPSNQTLTDVYNSRVRVNSRDSSGSFITNTVIMNTSYGAFSQSCTTNNGSCAFNLTQNLSYFFVSNPVNYTAKNVTFLVDEYTETINFVHLVERTFNLSIKDEITNKVIDNVNFSIEIIGVNSATNYTTSNGTLIISLLTPDNYTIRYQGGNYPLRDYYETIGQESYFNITLYALTAGNATDTLVTVEDTTGDAVEGATVQLLRYYNDCNCYRVVEMGKTGYNGLTYLISQEASGFYKWLIEYRGTTQFISAEPERLIASTITGQITRTITIDLGSNYYESFTALTDISGSVNYNDLTETLSFTWNDPSSIVTSGCIRAEHTVNARWVTFGQTCANGATGSVLLTLNNTNTTSYKWSAVVDTSSTFSSHTLDAGWINPTGSALFGKVAAFSSLFIIVGGAALFSFSAVAVLIWIALSLVVFIGIQIAGLITILPFTLQLITGFVALIIGISLYLMRR